jgi:hypothetical protein
MQGSAADMIRIPATPGSSPEESWSWDLEAAALAAKAEEPWSWDLDGAVLTGNSFPKNGKHVPKLAHWAGNPAGELQASAANITIPTQATPSVSPPQAHLAVIEQGQTADPGWDLPPAEAGVGVQAGEPPAPLRPGMTLVRRGVGVAAVLFLLGCAIFYFAAPDLATSASSPSTTANSSARPAQSMVGSQSAPPGAVPSSAAPLRTSDPRPPTATSTPSAGGDTGSGSAKTKAISVKDSAVSAKPFQTVRIQGTYRGGADTLLQVERWEGGRWLAFPLPTKTDQSGQFTTYVELGQPGRYRLRVLDPGSGVTSKPFVLVIKG